MTEETLVLRGATVVHPRTGTTTPDSEVVIDGSQIIAVRPRGSAPLGRSRVVDLDGRYLVPGYEEMHAHPLEGDAPGCYELMVAHGISGFRQMSGSLELLRRRTAGRLPLPELAPDLRELPGAVLTPLNGGSPEQAIETVREQVSAGADFIKSALLSPEAFSAAQVEAQRLGSVIAGHLPPGLDVEAASRVGIRSVEHLGPGVPLLGCCASDPLVDAAAHELRPPSLPGPIRLVPERILDGLLGPALRRVLVNPSNLTRSGEARALATAVDSFDVARAESLARRFTEDGTWQVPTLIRLKAMYRCEDREFTENDELRYVSSRAIDRWRSANARHAKLPEETRSALRAAYHRLLELTRLFNEAGVRMLTGSDVCVAGWLVPGFALHHEFDELASAGLPPLRVLQMATCDAADYLGLSEDVGLVAPGANADLVVLRADPRESVAHLHGIEGVVRAGRYLDRAALDGVLARAADERPGF